MQEPSPYQAASSKKKKKNKKEHIPFTDSEMNAL